MKAFQRDSGVHRRASVLVLALWSLVVLSAMVMGLSQTVKGDFILTKYFLGKQKARNIAVTGLFYVMDYFRQGKEGGKPQEVFKNIPAGDGHFDIYSLAEDGNSAGERECGFKDEAARLNINALSYNNYQILVCLIEDLGYGRDVAETIGSSVMDWKDEDHEVFNSPFGAEQEFYDKEGRGYACKNKPFESIEELLLVRGMTLEIFQKINNFLTVFPQNSRLLINVEQAGEPVLRAVARSFSGAQTHTDRDDADSLVRKILDYRRGKAGRDGPSADFNDLGLNERELIISRRIEDLRTKASGMVRFCIKGVESSYSWEVEVVLNRGNNSVAFWRQL